MIEIKDLLVRFKKILFKDEEKKHFILKVVLDITGIELNINNIIVKNNIIYLNTKPIYKNEIFLRKQEILNQLKGYLMDKTPTEIR